MTSLSGMTILVLEDEPIIAMALEDDLEYHGARPKIARTIEGAFSLLEQHQFDGAILDINIHGEKSYPVARVLLERKVPFVFASGYGDTLHDDQFAGVPTVTKPYKLERIEQLLGRAADAAV